MALPLLCSLHTPPPSLPSSFPSSSSLHLLLKFSPPNSFKFTLPALRPYSNHHRLSLSSLTASASLSVVDSPKSSHIQNEKNLLLEVKGLITVIFESKQQILKGVNLIIYKGEVHAIMGKNGSGKSTLAKVLVGHPDYEVTRGSVVFKGENLVEMEPEERSLAGLFMSFQSPFAILGVNNIDFLNMAYNAQRRKLGLPKLGPIEV
ncbi:abc transporter i family member 6 [Quercus suber]|uniref:Abc transporter i family member 6 n=1 Tax=Quercus suber TaxID=58331 RepID=A0AAW0JFQ5_QUESU|nr:ABC transporter I family member 6, chloroplastic-like [Quercus suber]